MRKVRSDTLSAGHNDRALPVSTPHHPPFGPIRIIHRDASLLIVEKPAGLLSVPGKSAALADCLLSRLAREDSDVRLVHRLDRDTSGVMVFARSAPAQRHLGLQFERRHVTKRYVACVTGKPKQDTGVIDLPLTADWPRRPMQKVCHTSGRPARTRWQVIARTQSGARLALTPETGRSHQLRVHLAEIGHPILGDPLYGSAYGGAPAHRLMLHAECLNLRHPEGGTQVSFTSAPSF